MAELQNRIVGVIGCKGAGKSSLAKNMFRQSRRALAYDSMAEYDFGLLANGRQDVIDFLLAHKSMKFRIIFRPGAGKEAAQGDFEWLSRVAFAVGGCDLFVEEIDLFCGAGYAEPGLDRLVRYGRHRGINLIYTTRRFQEISKGLTSQTDEYILFRIAEPNDLQAIERRFGTPIMERVRALQNHDSIRVDVREIGRESLPEGKENEPQKNRNDGSLCRGAGLAAAEAQ